MDETPIAELLPEFPDGPLSKYRHQATFDWRKLKIEIDGEDRLRFKHKIWTFLQNHYIFDLTQQVESLDDRRRLAHLRLKTFKDNKIILQPIQNPRLVAAFIDSMIMYNIDMSGLNEINYILFPNVIRHLGTERHKKFIHAIEANEISGCFSLTEIAHGSNAKGIMTTASYDVNRKQFILHCPSFEAVKCWSGNLGKRATHAIVYAKLITSDGENHGLHAFVVPIRCPRTLNPYPGVIVGDLGEKIALNGVDNGFLSFNLYRIPSENLLNRYGDVNEKGNYSSVISNPNKRLAALLGVLSSGRVQITIMSTNLLLKALTVAIRYSAVRKQFGPENSDEEYSVIEYQQQQFRLFPYIAVVYATKIFGLWFSEINETYITDIRSDPMKNDSLKSMEIHAISSATKPVASWTARDGIQVCREACGGHGYLKAAGIGDWRNENDGNCTYEGENSILIQQTSNWLLGLWKKVSKGEKIETPYGTAEFLNHCQKLPKSVKIYSTRKAVDPEVCLSAYKWLICYYLQVTASKIERLSKLGKDNFSVRNDTQSYHAATLSVIFAEHTILDAFYKSVLNMKDRNCKEVLMKLVSLYGAWNLEKHLGTLYMGKFLSEGAGQYLRDGIIELCCTIKPEAVLLMDTIAPPDFVLNSVLGNSDGQVYQHLQTKIFSNPDAFTRPKWLWKLKNNVNTIKSKL